MPQPNKPVPKPVKLEVSRTAIAVLDLGARCEDKADPCSELMPAVSAFLGKARTAGVPIIFTTSLMHKGTRLAEVAAPLERRPEEPCIQPDGFDKFRDGILQKFLDSHKTENLIIIGSTTNIAVLYTATTAARVLQQYQVYLPLDGVGCFNDYEQEYALHQLSTLPSPPVRPILFTSFPMLELV